MHIRKLVCLWKRRWRNPYSIRPYQHVLEPVFAYLIIAAKQYEHPELAGYYNVGPDECDCYQTGKLVDTFIKYWGDDLKRVDKCDGGPHEAGFLKLDCTKLKNTFDWAPVWNMDTAINKVIEWSKVFQNGGDVRKCMDDQILDFMRELNA